MNKLYFYAKNIFIAFKFNRLKFNFDYLNSYVLPLSIAPSNGPTSTSIDELMQDGILWGVPKKKRNVERRLRRRFGVENYPDCTKIQRPRDDLIICERCGDHHEYYTLCPTCYSKVKQETDKIREEIRKQINPLEPKEKEVFLQFKNEEPSQETLKRFKVINIDRERPQWFSSNLMVKSTSKQTEVHHPKDVIMDAKDLIEQNNSKK